MRTLRPGTDQLLRDTRQLSVEDNPMRRLDEMENPTLAGRALPWTFDEHPMIRASNSVMARCVNLRDQEEHIYKNSRH